MMKKSVKYDRTWLKGNPGCIIIDLISARSQNISCVPYVIKTIMFALLKICWLSMKLWLFWLPKEGRDSFCLPPCLGISHPSCKLPMRWKAELNTKGQCNATRIGKRICIVNSRNKSCISKWYEGKHNLPFTMHNIEEATWIIMSADSSEYAFFLKQFISSFRAKICSYFSWFELVTIL